MRRGRQPEENISRARKVFSPRFLYCSSLMGKRYLAMWMWLCEVKLKVKTSHFRLPSASQKRSCLSSLMWQHWSLKHVIITLILLFWKYDNLFPIFCQLKTRGSPAFLSWITKWEEKITFPWKVDWSTWHNHGTKKKIWVSDRNLTHHLPNTGKALYPLHELQELMESRVI